MLRYKNHPIDVVAIPRPGKLWALRGLVFDPQRPTNELKRLECPDVICTSSKEAEDYALQLCNAWIDRQRTH
jgi:hypothetical protein